MVLEITQKASPEQAQRLEVLADRRDKLQEAFDKLRRVEEIMSEENEWLQGSLPQMIKQVETLILQAQDEAMEIQVEML